MTDTSGPTSASSAQVEITNIAPSGTLNAPSSAFAGFSFTLSLTSPTDPSVADTAAGFGYVFDCGAGTGYAAFGAVSASSCATSLTGVRDVGVKIRDKDDGISEYRATVKIVVTYDSLCDLTKARVTKRAVATLLCIQPTIAEVADAHGLFPLRDAVLRDYRRLLDA